MSDFRPFSIHGSATSCPPPYFRALVYAVALLATSTLHTAIAGEETVTDGVRHVRNGATPSAGAETLHLQEVWRVGGDDDETTLFGLVTSVGGDEDGNVYIMDAQLCQVQVYTPDGELLRTLFRQGEGPGEIQEPRDMVMMSDGSVGLVQEFPGKIVLVDRMGVPQSNFTPGGDDPTRGGVVGLIAATSRGEHFICTGQGSQPTGSDGTQQRTHFLARFLPDGQEAVRYLEHQHVRDYNNFTLSERNDTPAFWWASDIGPDGRVYSVADRDQYAISVFQPDGTLDLVIERDYEPWKRTPEEFERIRLLFESAIHGIGIPYTLDIEEFEPAISYLHRPLRVADDGTLWVVTSRGIRQQAKGIMLTYDLFDRAGHFTRRVAVECEGHGVNDALFFLGDDRVILVKGYLDALAAQFGGGTALSGDDEEPSVPEIVCYRVDGRD